MHCDAYLELRRLAGAEGALELEAHRRRCVIVGRLRAEFGGAAGVEVGSRILRVGVSVPLHPHVDAMTWLGCAFMSASPVSTNTHKCLPGVVGAVRLRFLGPDDRRIIMFDYDDEWWRVVEARRGHEPHGASRRRAHSPAERVRARPEVDLMINRGQDGVVNAGAVREGCSKECQWFVVRRSNTRRRPIP